MATYKPQVKQANGTMADLNLDAATLNGKAESALSVSYATSAGSAVDQTARNGLNGKLDKTGGTVTGDLIVTAPHRDTYYASNVCRHFSGSTPTEYVIKTKIRYVNGRHMPIIRIYGYAYGLRSPIELRLGFYIYGDTLGWCGAVSTGAWKPDIYLFSYMENDIKYVAVGFKGSCYFCGFQVDTQIGAIGSFNEDFSIDGWITSHNGDDTSKHIVPDVGVSDCINVPYRTMKTDISGTSGNASKLNGQDPSYYLNYNNLTNKPTRIANADNADHADEADMAFSANTAQYASSAGEADHAGYAAQLDSTLPISGGGTGATTAAAARTNLGLKAVASSGSYTDLTNKPTIVSQVKVGDTAYNPVNGVVSLPAYPTPSGGGKLYKHTIEMMCTMSMNFDEIRLTYYSTSETAFNDVPSLFAYLSGVDAASPVPFSEYKKQIYPCFILDTMGSSVYGSGTAAIYYDPNISTPMGMGDYVMDYVYVNGFNERAEELGHITEDFMIENTYSAVAEM